MRRKIEPCNCLNPAIFETSKFSPPQKTNSYANTKQWLRGRRYDGALRRAQRSMREAGLQLTAIKIKAHVDITDDMADDVKAKCNGQR